ncbi:uncharacterized protein LOC141592746 isoform X1 [Silene latifolia]|uniref:uncharacterized protein LOC141592746 isoform X1 n=1 Tax=Silene latifolia TaxID=37657 RepID=UPI003D77F95A
MELFYNLCHLEVSNLEKLAVLLPVNPLPRKMTTLNISNCHNLTYIFSEVDEVNKESDIIKLPCLKMLALDMVSNLMSVIKESNKDNNDDSRRPSFFNSKVTLTSLEELSLNNNGRIVKLWDMESKLQSFLNLKVLKISDCSEMETIGPPSMFFSLVQLESLSLNACGEMKQVISDGSERDEIPKEIIAFPKLKRLQISCMDKLKCFCGGSYKMVFPRLEVLSLHNLSSMTKFAGGTSSTGFFPKTIEFPCLEDLWLSELSVEVIVLWELHEGEGQGISSNPLPKLKTISVEKIKLPSTVFQNLSGLTLEPVDNAKFLFSSSSSENEGCVGTYSHFPKLEGLNIQHCPDSVQQLVEFVDDDGSLPVSDFCEQLRSLTLRSALNMEVTSLHPFTNLRDLSIYNLTWEYMFSTNGGVEHLQSLEKLTIEDCPKLKAIIPRGDKDNTIVFPRLKILYLSNLKSMIKLCSISDIPFHFPSLKDLSIVACNKLEWHLDGEPNQVVELPSLENVTIDACDAMTSFSTRPLKAPKLRELTVHNCLKMEWFLLGNSNNNADLELPSLEEVTIEVCPEMKSFSPAFLRAPRLQLVKIDGKLYPITENEDLNHFLQSANSSEQIAADENDL